MGDTHFFRLFGMVSRFILYDNSNGVRPAFHIRVLTPGFQRDRMFEAMKSGHLVDSVFVGYGNFC